VRTKAVEFKKKIV